MVDGDVCINVMASMSTTMASMKRFQRWRHLHIVHVNAQFVGEAIRPRSLLEGPLVYDERALEMGTINMGTSQGNVNRFWRWCPKHSQIGVGKK